MKVIFKIYRGILTPQICCLGRLENDGGACIREERHQWGARSVVEAPSYICGGR